MQMVILCGGLATRLGDLAKNTPKSMIDIHGKPFMVSAMSVEEPGDSNILELVEAE